MSRKARPAGHRHLLDRAAIGLSVLCLLHCLTVPILLAILPAIAMIVPIGPGFHILMLSFASIAAAGALLGGQAVHGRTWPLILGLVGLFFIAVGVLAFEGAALETVLTVIGVMLLAPAHFANMRMRHGRAVE